MLENSVSAIEIERESDSLLLSDIEAGEVANRPALVPDCRKGRARDTPKWSDNKENLARHAKRRH